VRSAVERGRGDVTFLGSLPPAGVRAQLATSSLFILPSHEEGQPIAILEAMAAGLPVVVTTIGANPDVVRDGVDGFLVPPRDPAALADAVGRLVGDPALRARMGASARQRAHQHFDRGVLRRRLLDEYAAAAQDRHRRR
jgi:glycosyltransferase involved in cell wall biosynthesis